MKHLFLFLLIFIPITAFTQTTWMPVSYIVTVKIKNVDVTVTEKFICLHTDFKFSPGELSSSHFKSVIRVATTIINKPDEKSIDSGTYTQVDVESLSIYKKGTQYAGKFNITIHGFITQVEIPFEFNQSGNDAEFRSNFNVNARNFAEGIKDLTMNRSANVSIYIKAKS